eukprot:CAMPEP_0197442236 /NCGR_PEP_ID=MMETSP1175-20131217/8302_1 /TAXON_ID=1003142 /ORGANISM="Triceratium dubium, Strain CCMP147" /LENGTH=44 /DNA_ID= /DNA_START= /DNA_END= /DNA_ORIENTATION=
MFLYCPALEPAAVPGAISPTNPCACNLFFTVSMGYTRNLDVPPA